MKVYGVFRVLDGFRRRQTSSLTGPSWERDPGVTSSELVVFQGSPLISQTFIGAQKLKDYFLKNRRGNIALGERMIEVHEMVTLTTQDIVPIPPQELVAD